MPLTMAPVWSFEAPWSGRLEYRSTVPPPPPPPLVLVLLLLLDPQAASPTASASALAATANVRPLTFRTLPGWSVVARHPRPVGRLRATVQLAVQLALHTKPILRFIPRACRVP